MPMSSFASNLSFFRNYSQRRFSQNDKESVILDCREACAIRRLTEWQSQLHPEIINQII